MVTRLSSGPTTTPRSLSAGDWIRVATEALVESGLGAVAVEPLALRLGATKGSFYHHFDNRDALVAAALDAWERSQTEEVIDRLRLIPDPAARLRAVVTTALLDRPGGLRDAALLSSATDPLIKPVVARVTARRLRYMTETYAEMGLTRARARRRALLLYTAYVGVYEYLRVELDRLSDVELRAYANELLDALVVPTTQSSPRAQAEAASSDSPARM